ncbi:polysaccharide pyruvyl transferase family protein [Methylohalobius crimeensis]|uniref:polysaccharide pyruvyl transferase family protein n=1 Tax=Methylohalobius crimeensis TaxID=244365 RepID=UPI0003B45B10|nr:polysaccharide pyruvyl transferase family protein [Methylohalobius crimeensis]
MMTDKPYYVLLTGSKNNAGDFLIKHRAKQLLQKLRSDRELVDLNGWMPFDDSSLDVVNRAKALILLGGPALQKKMRPKVYGLVDDLSKIRVPIVTAGIGWYSPNGEWKDTHDYALNQQTHELLDRIAGDAFLSSVRDYHTLNTLHSLGYSNYAMTGCPALYSWENLGKPVQLGDVNRVAFSLGVGMKSSRRMERQMRSAILCTAEEFSGADLSVVFHHGLSDNYLSSPGVTKELYKANKRMAAWLDSENIAYIDVSGSAEALIEHYSGMDFHIGYRVHAHIFMSSISKPSILLNEDGRGKALGKVLGGTSLDAYEMVQHNKVIIIANRVGIPIDTMRPARGFLNDLRRLIRYEKELGVRLQEPRDRIDRHFPVMKTFMERLP